MKICFFVDSIFSFGGVQRITAVIARYLAANHEVTILTMDNPSSEDTSMYELNTVHIEYEYFKYFEIPLWTTMWSKAYSGFYKTVQPTSKYLSDIYGVSSFPKKNQKKLVELLNSGKYDVIIGVHAFLSLRLASIRDRLRCPRVIGWMHNSYRAFFELENPYLPRLKYHFKNHMRHLDEVVVLCQDDQKLFKDNLNMDVSYIYNPVTLEAGEVAGADNKRFLTVGRLTPTMKGHDVLIAAFSVFAKKHPDWTLEIVGEGPAEGDVKKWIEESGVSNQIILSPFTNNIQAHYSAASVYVLPSRWEGMPLVLMEALSHGLPLICSDLPVCEELVGSSDFAEIFHVADVDGLVNAMNRMAETDLSVLQKECLDKAAEFSLTNITNHWLKLLGIDKK